MGYQPNVGLGPKTNKKETNKPKYETNNNTDQIMHTLVSNPN